MDRSFQLVRTNPRLTTNIKLVVDSNYNLYFESFDSSKELSNQKYKHYLLNREAYMENEIPKFYSELPKNLAFSPKTLSDADIMYNEYKYQFDSTYYSGANEVDDQWYLEEFEYLAPLYIKKGEIPQKFIILRVDDPAIYKLDGDDYIIDELSKDNFRNEIIDKWKCVTVFDLSNTTTVGKFFDRNINNNSRFPDYSFFFDTKSYNYSKWSGLDYKTGVYKVSEMYLDDKTYYSNPHFNFEEFITKGFEDNGIIYPNILNIKFLFDDTPATPNELKKWSMNRYYGFYSSDFELVKSITSYDLPELKDGLTIKNNIFLSGTKYVNPYVIEYTDNKWIQVDNSFYEVKLQSNGSYKIISDTNLTGYDISKFNKNKCTISFNGDTNYITGIGDIDEYINTNGEIEDMYADIYLIEILGNYHILKKDSDGNHYIQTDYAITSNKDILQYWKGGKNNNLSGTTSVTNTDGSPLVYNIYRVKLIDIKDFDFDRIHTHYSDFDYEKSEYTETSETKLYAKEYRDISIPTRNKTYDKGEDGQYKQKIISSEYTSDDETFEIRSSVITPMFEKNQSICKWGFDGSISHSDYPYKLNNNYDCGGVYNRTTNTTLKTSNIKEKTLDYFYRINEFYNKDVDNVYTGFTSSYESDWTISTTGASSYWDVDHIQVLAASGGIIYFDLNTPITKNEIYYVDLEFSNVLDSGISFSVGVSDTSLPYASTTNSGRTSIKLVSRTESTTFRLFVTDANINLNSITLTSVIDKYYLNQSTNIQTRLHSKYELDSYRGFNLQYYINSDFDYFEFFFKNNMYYEDFGKSRIKPYIKYSTFEGGDNDLPATTLFKGIQYKLYNIQDMVLNTISNGEETIRNIITEGGSEYNGYKFSMILSENYNLYNFINNNGEYTEPLFISNRNTSVYGTNLLLNSIYDGIHIFLNKKFKNVLIIINKNIPINIEWGNLNNVDVFGENYGLYFGKTLDGYNIFPITGTSIENYNPTDLSASNFIDSLNNLNTKFTYDKYVHYYLIDENGDFAKTEMIKFNEGVNSFNDITYWSNKFPTFYMETDTSDSLSTKKTSYVTTALKGPETNIYDKYLVYSNRVPLMESYINEPLSRQIDKFEVDQTKTTVIHGETISNVNTIYRYVGYYEPIFKNLSIFEPSYFYASGDTYNSITGNYVFGDSLEQFGIIEEIMYSKVNEYENYLKLKNSDTERSYYPMVDEIGLSQTNRFIFLSPWDRNFYIKTLNEQTLLEDYVAIPVQTVTSSTYAKVLSSSMYRNNTLLSNGVNLYSDNLDTITGLTFTITIQNLSVDVKNIGLRMYYTSSLGSTSITTVGTSPDLSPNDTYTFTYNTSRPNEITSGNVSEYTLWNVYFECYDASSTSVILDSQTYNNFNIYNDLISFVLLNASYDGTNHITGNAYNFNVDLLETKNKLTNVSFNAQLIFRKYSSSSFWTGSTLINQTITSLKTINFNNVYLSTSGLGWPYLTTDYTDVTYYVYHNYTILGVTYQKTASITLNNYMITGESQPYNLIWAPTIPTITIQAGTCLDYTFSGDIVKVAANTVGIKNTGGNFVGQIIYNLTLYENNSPTTMTSTYVKSVNINNGSTYYYDSVMTLGPTYSSGIALITWLESDYEVRITASLVSGILMSTTTYGKHLSTFNCGSSSCLDENTLVVMSDGNTKPIKHLSIGEKVLSYRINNDTSESISWVGDIRTGKFDTSLVKSLRYAYVKGYYVINDTTKATPDHTMMVKTDNGLWKWMAVKDIKVNYKMFNEKGNIININNIVYMDAYINVVKIDVEDTDNYFAGNTLNHNLKYLITTSEEEALI